MVYLKKNVDISVGFDASGFDVRASSQPFEIISFPNEFSQTAKIANMPVGFTRTAREFNHTAGETVEIKWILKPTEVGKGWTVPLNIAFNFYDRDKRKQVPFSYTVANIEIKKRVLRWCLLQTDTASSTLRTRYRRNHTTKIHLFPLRAPCPRCAACGLALEVQVISTFLAAHRNTFNEATISCRRECGQHKPTSD